MTEQRSKETRSQAQLLVVEDDDAMRELVLEELSDQGFNVIGATNGLHGIQIAKVENIDVIITDLRMPDVDGFDLIRDISSKKGPMERLARKKSSLVPLKKRLLLKATPSKSSK